MPASPRGSEARKHTHRARPADGPPAPRIDQGDPQGRGMTPGDGERRKAEYSHPDAQPSARVPTTPDPVASAGANVAVSDPAQGDPAPQPIAAGCLHRRRFGNQPAPLPRDQGTLPRGRRTLTTQTHQVETLHLHLRLRRAQSPSRPRSAAHFGPTTVTTTRRTAEVSNALRRRRTQRPTSVPSCPATGSHDARTSRMYDPSTRGATRFQTFTGRSTTFVVTVCSIASQTGSPPPSAGARPNYAASPPRSRP